MADIETTIASSGADYASLAAAEADSFGCSAGQSALCEYAEEMTDTTPVTINTTTPSDIEISVQSAYRSNGDVSSGACFQPSSGPGITISTSVNLTINYLRIDMTNGGHAIYYQGSGTHAFNDIFIHNVPAGSTIVRLQYGSTSTLTFSRCIISTQASSGTGTAFLCGDSDFTVNCYFCTVRNPAYYGFRRTGGTLNTYGCVSFASYPYYGTIGGDYNADDTSGGTYQAPGANSVHNLTPANELTDPSSDDFTIKSGGTGTLIDLVATDAYNAYFPDIAGNNETGSHPDCGAFEVAAGGASYVQTIMLNHDHFNGGISL
jgi:hypothetical protein